jgi:hypothetical protein
MKHVVTAVTAVTARTCAGCATATHRWVPVTSEAGSLVSMLCPRCARQEGHLPARFLGTWTVDQIADAVADAYHAPVPELSDEEWDTAAAEWADLMNPNVYGAQRAAMLAVARAAGILPAAR